jgi:DDE family transposase
LVGVTGFHGPTASPLQCVLFSRLPIVDRGTAYDLSQKPAVGRKLIELPGYVFRVFVTNRNDAALEIWRDYNGRAALECRIDELKNELAVDHFCLRSFFATESAFLAVLFSFNLLSEFQRAIDPALKSYKQAATLRFEVFTCGAILGRSGHYLILHVSKNWGGYSKRKPLFSNLLHWPPPTSPKFTPPVENAA